MKMTEECNMEWMKVAKYKLAAFFSFHTQQPLPPAPFKCEDKPGHILSGSAGRWLTSKLKSDRNRLSLLASIKQSKKGMPRPDKEEMEKETQEYLKTMITPIPDPKPELLVQDWNELDDYPLHVETIMSKDTIIIQLERTVDEIFPPETSEVSNEERYRPFFPSTSANYINNRKGLGAIGTIFELDELPGGILAGLRTSGGAIKITSVNEEESITEDPHESFAGQFDFSELDRRFKVLWLNMLILARNERNVVDPVALAEALKTRMITKGPPMRMTVLRFIWKAMHSRMRRQGVFRLIGEGVSEKVILDRLGRNLKEDQEYTSGDYRQATNNLCSWISNTVCRRVSKNFKLSDLETRLFEESLTGHIFETGEQKRGQLMGSITSFPVLCIANAAICRWAMEVAEARVIKLSDAALLINGDDCAFRSNKRAYPIWSRLASACGLEESMGKTYHSEKFVEINSTIFERRAEPKTLIYEKDGKKVERLTQLYQVGFVNTGLMSGIKRSGAAVGLGDLDDPRSTLGNRARELLRYCPESLHESVMQRFLTNHRTLLDSTRLPWYIPEWLGGVGLPSGPWGEPSELDRRIARRILFEWTAKKHPIQLGHKETNWKCWQLASDKLPPPVYTNVKGKHTEEYSSVVGKKVIDLLFDSDIDISDLHKRLEKGKETSAAKAIRINAKLWRPKKNEKLLPQPMTDEELKYIGLYPNWTFEADRRSIACNKGEGDSLVVD
jgi:hypothetical protein